LNITKSEAISLNLWKEIKDILDIDEGTIEIMETTLNKMFPHGASFQEEVQLLMEFPPNWKFDLSPGEILILSKKIQGRDGPYG